MPKLRNFTGWYVAVTLCTIALFFAPVSSRAKIWYVGYLVLSFSVITLLSVGAAFVSRLLSGSETITNAIPITGRIVWGLGYLIMNYGVLMKAQRTQKLYYGMVAYPTWVEKREKWERLYYCYTHDCVFDPDTGVSAPPERMGILLQ